MACKDNGYQEVVTKGTINTRYIYAIMDYTYRKNKNYYFLAWLSRANHYTSSEMSIYFPYNPHLFQK